MFLDEVEKIFRFCELLLVQKLMMFLVCKESGKFIEGVFLVKGKEYFFCVVFLSFYLVLVMIENEEKNQCYSIM